ncbi:MAG: FHA domain-containing protein [Gemmatimonadales bacterium]
MRRFLFVVLLAGLAGTAEAQIKIPFFGKKKKEPAADSARKPPEELPAPGSVRARQAAVQDSTKPGAPAALQAPDAGAAPAVTPTTPGAGGLRSPEEEQALQNAIAQALQADAAPDTAIAHLRERIARWRQVLLIDNNNTVALNALNAAQDELKAANDRAFQAGNQTQTQRQLLADRLNQAEQDIRSSNFTTAIQHIRVVLDQDSSNIRAKSLLVEAEKGRRLDDLKRQAMYVIPVLLVLAGMLVLVVRFGARYREQRQRRIDEIAAKRSAVLQIVDGVGRGKLVTIDKERPIFKIGAAQVDQETERNDLIVSDSSAAVSRFHCTLIRKDGEYYLVDSSLNGTAVNGERLKRGDHFLLEDGDEITLADVSRLKFLHT